MPWPRRFSLCYKKGNRTPGKYLYLNARNPMATYDSNNNYTYLQKIPDDYGYPRATSVTGTMGAEWGHMDNLAA
jgi:hypothetical protein